jgi:Rps23 Pro-64 3,4-dihydroxylase Tpa1-like proline 4-hydroxylase
LSPAWKRLATDLVSPEYRAAVTRLTGIEVGALPMEANVFHYGAQAWLGPHLDLPEKRVTHVLYFNDVWPVEDGGCIAILNSSDIEDAVAILPPIIGTSVLLVRSTSSWHAVTPVRQGCHTSRRCVVVTFYAPGSISTMWPPGDETPLRDHVEGRSRLARWVKRRIGALRR